MRVLPVDSLIHAAFDRDKFSDGQFSGLSSTPADSTAITSLADQVSFVVKTRLGPEQVSVPDGFGVVGSDSDLFDQTTDVLVDNMNYSVETIVTAELGNDLVHVQVTDANKLYLIKPSTLDVSAVIVYALDVDGINNYQITPDSIVIDPEQIEITFATAQKFKVVVTVAS